MKLKGEGELKVDLKKVYLSEEAFLEIESSLDGSDNEQQKYESKDLSAMKSLRSPSDTGRLLSSQSIWESAAKDQTSLQRNMDQLQEQTSVKLDHRRQTDLTEKLRKEQKRSKVQQVRLRNNAIIHSHSPKPQKPSSGHQVSREFDSGILNLDLQDALFQQTKKSSDLQGGFFNQAEYKEIYANITKEPVTSLTIVEQSSESSEAPSVRKPDRNELLEIYNELRELVIADEKGKTARPPETVIKV